MRRYSATIVGRFNLSRSRREMVATWQELRAENIQAQRLTEIV
jgi:hypothetical protein